MVHVASLGRHQLRDGLRRMGGALGPLLARSSLPVKEWGSEPDGKHDKLLVAEGLAVGFSLLGIYIFMLLEVILTLTGWVQYFFA